MNSKEKSQKTFECLLRIFTIQFYFVLRRNKLLVHHHLKFTIIIEIMPEHSPAPTPSRGIYGFVLYLLFSTLFILYILWAFMPDSFFKSIGITELPNKYFALFIPILILTATTFFGFLIYPSMSFIMTPNIDSIHTITDSSAIRRCQIKTSDGIQCDEKIQLNSGTWRSENICNDHQEKKPRIENFCDCVEKEKCLLQIDPQHTEKLNKRENLIKNSGDLDIVEVSRILYKE